MLERAQGAVVRNPPERDDGCQLWHFGNRCFEEAAAGVDLGRRWFVLRRHATHRIGDAGVDEFQTVVRTGPTGAAGKAIARERAIEELARMIAGERPPGAVCALEPGRQ